MKYSEFKKLVELHLSSYKLDHLNCIEHGLYNNKTYCHILPKEKLLLNFLPSIRDIAFSDINKLNYNLNGNISLHKYAHHLNSSQIMCINLFAPFLLTASGKNELVNIFSELLNTSFKGAKIVQAGFEYEPNYMEKTNFDFYCKLSTGEQIFLEAKYTEQYFGKTSPDKKRPDKYEDKWVKIYKTHVEKSMCLKNISKEEFYKHYQIYRNISYIRTEKDYTVFLFPKKSDYLLQEITKTTNYPKNIYKNVKILDWLDFLHLKNTPKQSMSDFEEKYLCYNN